MNKEIIELLEKARNACKTVYPTEYTELPNYIDQALTLLKQQPKAGEFTKEIRFEIKTWHSPEGWRCPKCNKNKTYRQLRVIGDNPDTQKHYCAKCGTFLSKEPLINPANDKNILDLCDRLDRAEAINKDLLEACEEYIGWFEKISRYQNQRLGHGLKEAEQTWGEASIIEPFDCSKMIAAIANAKKVGD